MRPTAGKEPVRPQRSCVGCRQAKGKPELVQLVVVDGRIVANPGPKARGRSAYLCREPACWATAEKRRALDRALGVTLTADDWRQLRVGIVS
ncbi:MAG: YlxR family protein [Candidatus Dormibacteraeota bacterium]|nr:YlxR family protein [Candidatus Dormibacteraeota bacterium]